MQIKNVQGIVLGFSLLLLTTLGCKKKDDKDPEPFRCATCITTPQAAAANDASSKGIYKGVVIGSSGTISFNIMNNGTTITSTMIINGTTVNLTSAVTWVAGQAYVAPFTGTLNGSAVSITFSVNSSGGTPMVTTSSIPGHPNSSFTIVKETSSSLVECMEGTYHTTLPEDGTFNIILSRTTLTWRADSRKNGATTTNAGNGTIVNNQLIDPASNNRVIGTLNGDDLNGSFVDGNGKTVTLSGKRTL